MHTPLPWKVYEKEVLHGWLIEGPLDDGPIAEIPKLNDAEFIVRACNSNANLLEALEEIAEGKGVFNRDRLTHAENVIENLTAIAKQAIVEAKKN